MDKNPVLLLDVDGVLYDIITPSLAYVNAKLGTSYTYEQCVEWNWADCFDQEAADLFKQFLNTEAAWTTGSLYSGVLDGVNRLREHYFILIATAVVPGFEHVRRQWLEDNGIIFDHYECGTDKVAIARSHGATFALEDNHKNAVALASAGITTHLIYQPWNVSQTFDLSYRGDWDSAVRSLVVRAEAAKRGNPVY